MIAVTLFGPPRVERDGALVAFDTRKAMAVLAHLAVTDRPRPRDALADLLWPDTDPDRARGALRRTLTSLRRAVGPDLVEATRDHVRLLKGSTITVDVDLFRARRAGGDLEGAARVFGGDFLEGFAVRDAPGFEDWAEIEGGALRRELMATLADLSSAREAAGDPTGAIPLVRRWLALDSLHEPAHRALIRLYAASGDRGAALMQYRECVRTLFRELGVAPLTETTQLYEAINRGSYSPPPRTEPSEPPGPAAPPESPAVPGRTPFVGRDADLRALHSVHDGIRDHGRVVLIEGEAGIGKTRLVEELLRTLRGRGTRVLAGRAYEDEAGLAYAPLVDALRGRLREAEGWLANVPDRALVECSRLLPELAVRRPGLEREPAAGPGAETRFLSGVWDTLVAAAGGGTGPGVLLVDDAQWADDATLAVLSYGMRRLAGRALLVVMVWRTPHEHPARRAAGAVAGSEGGATLHLGRLDEAAVGELVAATLPAERDHAIARRLWETTEGVPLLLVEYLRTLDAAALDGSRMWPLPARARELLRARLDPVGETSRQVLAAAAVLGRFFDVATVRAVSGRSEEETATSLEEVVRCGLVREGDGNTAGAGDYDFIHELVRAMVYSETGLARRRLLHGRAADVLRTPAAAVARHLQFAGRDDEAAPAFRMAGDQARAVFANAEALGHYRAALALGHPDRAALHVLIGDVQTVLGDYAEALRSLERAAAGDGAVDAAAVEHRLGRLQHRRGEYALAQAHLEAALARTAEADLATRAGVVADLSLAASSRGDAARARSLAEQARGLAEAAGDDRALGQAHNLLGMLATADGDISAAIVHLGRSRELAERIDEPDLRIAVRNNLALAHRARGELATAIELTRDALDQCTALGDRHREAALLNNLADLMHATGRPDEAMAHLKAAVEIFADVGADEQPRPEIWKLYRW